LQRITNDPSTTKQFLIQTYEHNRKVAKSKHQVVKTTHIYKDKYVTWSQGSGIQWLQWERLQQLHSNWEPIPCNN